LTTFLAECWISMHDVLFKCIMNFKNVLWKKKQKENKSTQSSSFEKKNVSTVVTEMETNRLESRAQILCDV